MPPSPQHVFLRQRSGAAYPSVPPFHPSEAYPEYPWRSFVSDKPNAVYAMVRDLFHDMGLDRDRYGTPEWNPLGEIVKPGMRVLVKPNIVLHEHPKGGDYSCLVTHASVTRAVLDYLLIALKGEGAIVIGDSPLQGTDFDEAVRRTGLREVVEWVKEWGRGSEGGKEQGSKGERSKGEREQGSKGGQCDDMGANLATFVPCPRATSDQSNPATVDPCPLATSDQFTLVSDPLSSPRLLSISLTDFRLVHAVRDRHARIVEWRDAPGDPNGYVEFDLGSESALEPISGDAEKFRISQYRSEETQAYHRPGSHRYLVTRSLVDADVVINLPKLKTHCKAGVTLGMKNFVGTVGRKQCLAHHREGGAPDGGDEFPDNGHLKRSSAWLEHHIDGMPSGLRRSLAQLTLRINMRLIKVLGISPLRDGGWSGNDSCWRMVEDLVRIALFGGRIDPRPRTIDHGLLAMDHGRECQGQRSGNIVQGQLYETQKRVIFTLIDGIVAGENEGPLECSPIQAGTLVAGLHPVSVDLATTKFMGFDDQKLALFRSCRERFSEYFNMNEPIRVVVNGSVDELDGWEPDQVSFKPAEGWVGAVERDSRT